MGLLIITSLLLGVGLAMDACAVSLTNGLNEPKMRVRKALLIAFTFGFFQALMPMIGWTCVTLVVDSFADFAKFVPYIAFALLAFIGGKMLYDGIKDIKAERKAKQAQNDETEKVQTADGIGNAENDTTASESQNEKPQIKNAVKLTFWALLIQAVATSIDALSTGFSLADIAGSNVWYALLSCGIIAIVTFAISLSAVFIGKKMGDKLGAKAEVLGGVVLIAIGLEILIKGIWF